MPLDESVVDELRQAFAAEFRAQGRLLTADDLLRYERLNQRDYENQRRIDSVLEMDAGDHATISRDYGRGFAEALRLVKEKLES